ncbi:MAG: hypothetical protein BRC33_00655 [Cyanobacteria bacterium SW_9_44_58]|nr:MAG: hypothetical protein BRC33_00655 [Cyanobacteria bacterium SW_9_44_58]
MEQGENALPIWEYKVVHLNIKNTETPSAEAASSATKGTFSPEFIKQEFPDIYSTENTSDHPARQLQEALNRLGKEGWELIEISQIGSLTMMFLKRMKSESNDNSE